MVVEPTQGEFESQTILQSLQHIHDKLHDQTDFVYC